jgi:hypothetical protein
MILKMKHKIYKESTHFQIFIFIETYNQKTCHLPKQLYAFFIKICKKHYSKIHLYEKVFFGQKDMQSFSKVMPLAHFISLRPNINFKFPCMVKFYICLMKIMVK